MSCVSPTQEVPLPCSSPSRPTLPQPTAAFARNLLSLYLTFNLRFNNSGIEYIRGNTAAVDSPPSLRSELPRFAARFGFASACQQRFALKGSQSARSSCGPTLPHTMSRCGGKVGSQLAGAAPDD